MDILFGQFCVLWSGDSGDDGCSVVIGVDPNAVEVVADEHLHDIPWTGLLVGFVALGALTVKLVVDFLFAVGAGKVVGFICGFDGGD